MKNLLNVFWLNVKFMETKSLTDLLLKSSKLDQETVSLSGEIIFCLKLLMKMKLGYLAWSNFHEGKSFDKLSSVIEKKDNGNQFWDFFSLGLIYISFLKITVPSDRVGVLP